jgi:hypothetical protein
MDVKGFVARLKEIVPDKNVIKKYYYDDDAFSEEIIDGYFVKKLDEPCVYEDPLLQLCACYETNFSLLTQIGLNVAVSTDHEFYYIGNLEADSIVISKENGKVILISPSMGFVAKYLITSDTKRFIEVLSVILEVDPLIDGSDDRKKKWKAEQINRCANIAGGDEYKKFFEYYYSIFRKNI